MSHSHFTTGLSIIAIAAVLLSSLHAVQVANVAATVSNDDTRKALSHDAMAAKVASELHHHTDKTGLQLIKDVGDHQMYADSRSLRLVHKKDSIRSRLAAQWLRALHHLHLVNTHSSKQA